MRERNLLQVFLILNVTLAAAFVVYLFVSTSHGRKIVASNFGTKARPSNEVAQAQKPVEKAASDSVTAPKEKKAPEAVSAPVEKPKPVLSAHTFGWQDVERPEYLTYLQSLRDVGCPESKVRYIILADINEAFAKKRLKEAVAHDQEWWRAEPDMMLTHVLQQKGQELEEERLALIARLLGQEAADKERSESLLWNNVQLTGPVLGALPAEKHNEVQDICAKAMERHQSYFWSRANQGQPMNQAELAKLRQQTRTDLVQVLSSEGMQEFLLRYSYNANRLRAELRGMDPTPEEFRKIFAVTDPIDHQMQLEYGGVEALSEKQKERYERQRDSAIHEVLSPERYQAYLMTKDPLYRQAQMTALQFGAPPKVVMPLYEMNKTQETRRQKILNDASLTPQQKNEALNAVYQEQQRNIREIVTEALSKR